VAGYSRLIGVDEAGTAKALREHRAAIDPIVAGYRGRKGWEERMRVWTCFEYILVGAALVFMEPAVTADQNSWPMYGRNLQHTFANSGSQLTPGNAATLQPAWTYATRDAVSASPAVVDGVLYDGSWDGFFFALNAQTGALKWRIQLDCQASIVPLPEVCGGPPPPWVSGVPDPARFQTAGGIVTASPAVVGDRVYFSGGKTLYSVRTTDGAVIWKHIFCGNPEEPNCQADAADPAQILTSPAVFGNLFLSELTWGETHTANRIAVRLLR
jgi:glucose dehydrogenase